MHKNKTTAPQASMLIWNYKERFSADESKNPHEVDLLYLLTDQVISISTHKEKGRPTGRFEVKLAPTENWIARLTPGSWCAINMSQDIPIPFPGEATSIGPASPKADGRLLKWFGRIEDIRMEVQVDQQTGARQTLYRVTGSDWASIFESNLYIDDIFRNKGFDPNDGKFTAIGAAERLVYDTQALDYFKKGGLPTSEINVKGIIRIWGAPLKAAKDSGVNSQVGIDKLLLTSEGRYQFPKPVVQYMGLKTPTKPALPTTNIADALHVITGRLVSSDVYEPVKDAVGFIAPMSIFGTNTVWQLLLDNCNNVLNELVADLKITTSEDNTLPAVSGDNISLTLYSRIRPFVVRSSNFEGKSSVKGLVSNFKDVRQVNIPLEDVLSVDAGVNWNNMINFIEMRPNQQLNTGVSSAEFKSESQAFDKKSYERNGFKPKFANSKYIPVGNTGVLDPQGLTKWRFLLREWYFNQHNQLNGQVTFVGQNKYISVGDNIVIDSQILGKSRNMNSTEKDNTSKSEKMNLVAHVESIKHTFKVDPSTGSRSFITTVGFVRGVILPSNSISTEAMAIDKSTTELKGDDEITVDVVRTPTSNKKGS